MKASGLLISWATPAARVPTDAMRSASRRRASIRLFSETSSTSAMMNRRAPAPSRSALARTIASTLVPSFRRTSRGSSNRSSSPLAIRALMSSLATPSAGSYRAAVGRPRSSASV